MFDVDVSLEADQCFEAEFLLQALNKSNRVPVPDVLRK